MSVVEATRPSEARRQAAPAVERTAERHLRVVRAPSRARTRRRVLATAVVAVVAAALFLAVSSHVLLLQGQQQIDQLRDTNAGAQQRYNQLRLEVDRLEAPDRIVAEAARQGMVLPTDPVWLAPSEPVAQPDGTPSQDQDDSTANDQAQVKPYLGTAP